MSTGSNRSRPYRPGTGMRNFIACAGANGEEPTLKRFVEMAKSRKPDGLLFAGGITAPGDSRKDGFLNLFFKTLSDASQFVAVIPGPEDAPLSAFLQVARNAEIVYPQVSVAHATPIERGDIAVSGLGGMITESEDAGAPAIRYSHASAEYYLRSFWRMDQPIKLLLLSEPPDGKLGGERGNRLVREFVKSYHPYVCVVMGDSESRGSEKQDAHSLFVNPGLIAQGSAAWVEVPTKEVEMLDF